MATFIKWMDDLPWILKIIFAIPALDIVWAVYRIVKGVKDSNVLLLVLGILWIVPGATFAWLIDLITVIIYKHPILA